MSCHMPSGSKIHAQATERPRRFQSREVCFSMSFGIEFKFWQGFLRVGLPQVLAVPLLSLDDDIHTSIHTYIHTFSQRAQSTRRSAVTTGSTVSSPRACKWGWTPLVAGRLVK